MKKLMIVAAAAALAVTAEARIALTNCTQKVSATCPVVAFKVTANGTTTNKTEALAGFSAGQIGIGGAVAVQVDTVKTDAVVKDPAHVTLTGGPLNVTAANTVKLDTKASAKGAAKSENAGVGAGIAISVSGIETKAEIEDQKDAPVIKLKDDAQLSEVKVTASVTDTHTVEAVAGAASVAGDCGPPAYAASAALTSS